MAQVRSWNMFPKAQSNEIKKRLKGEFEGYLRQKKYENFVDSFLKIAVDGEVSDAIFDGSLYINFEDHTGKPIFESTLVGGLNSHIRVVNQSSNKTFFCLRLEVLIETVIFLGLSLMSSTRIF